MIVFQHGSVSVSAGIGGKVPGSVVYHSPVHELHMTITAHVIHIEKIGKRELPGPKFEPPERQASEHAQRPRLGLLAFLTKRDYIAKDRPGYIRRGAE